MAGALVGRAFATGHRPGMQKCVSAREEHVYTRTGEIAQGRAEWVCVESDVSAERLHVQSEWRVESERLVERDVVGTDRVAGDPVGGDVEKDETGVTCRRPHALRAAGPDGS